MRKTSLLQATIREYYQTKNYSSDNILYINNLKEQGIQYYRNEVKTFVKQVVVFLLYFLML